jgi:hypothetical protein
MLQGIDGCIPTIIESIAEKAPYITGRFDFLLIITLLFSICEDQSIPYSILEAYTAPLIFSFANGEELSGVVKTYRFSELDPLVVSHPFSHCSIYTFFHLDFVLNENSPQFVHDFIQNKKVFFTQEKDEQIPFFSGQNE